MQGWGPSLSSCWFRKDLDGGVAFYWRRQKTIPKLQIH